MGLTKLIRFAQITKAAASGQQFAVQQMRYLGKTADGLLVFPYGMHANVPPGALALMFSAQGNPDNRAAIAWDAKNRPDLAAGECAFYHPPTDATLIWRASGALDIETGGGGTADINVKAGNLNLEVENLKVTGDTEFIGEVKANGKVIDDTHGHVQANDSNGDAQQPINGVT